MDELQERVKVSLIVDEAVEVKDSIELMREVNYIFKHVIKDVSDDGLNHETNVVDKSVNIKHQ